MHRVIKRAKRHDGAVAVEFAVLLPLMLMILFAVIGFGQALSRVQGYVGAAREGARYVAVHCDNISTGCSAGAVNTRVQQAAGANNPIGVANVTVTQTNPGGVALPNCAPASIVSVSWTQPLTIEIPFIPTFNLSVPITGTFRCE
jgi:Flp pilus assembly protein TadG